MSKQKSTPLFCLNAASEKNMAIFPVRLHILTQECYGGRGTPNPPDGSIFDNFSYTFLMALKFYKSEQNLFAQFLKPFS